MRFLALTVVLLALLLAICQQATANPAYTGQPGCSTEEEITNALYPHFRNKRAYFRCSVLGQPGALELCPIAEGFLAPARQCVPWIEWYWTPTVAPPSSPAAAEGSGAGAV